MDEEERQAQRRLALLDGLEAAIAEFGVDLVQLLLDGCREDVGSLPDPETRPETAARVH